MNYLLANYPRHGARRNGGIIWDYAPWCWNIYLHHWAIFGVNLGKYSILSKWGPVHPGDFNGIFVGASRPLKKLERSPSNTMNVGSEPPSMVEHSKTLESLEPLEQPVPKIGLLPYPRFLEMPYVDEVYINWSWVEGVFCWAKILKLTW